MQDSATAREELQHAGAVPLCGLTFLHQCWPHHHDPQTHCSGKCISCRCGLSAWVVAFYVAGQLQSIWNFWNMLLHWIVMTVHWVVMTVISLNRHDCYFTESSWLFTSLNRHDCYFTESPWLFTESSWLFTSLNHHDCSLHWIIMTVHFTESPWLFTESSWLLLHWIVMTSLYWIIMTVTSLIRHDYSLNRHDCYFIKSSWPFTSLNCHECYFTESSWLFKLDLVYTSLSNKSSLNSDACTFFFVWWIHFCFIVFI